MTIIHEDYLVEHAYQNVWCAPGQDKQFIIEPARVTERRGALASVYIGTRKVMLPEKTKVYHVFTYGALPPTGVGMMPLRETWVRADVHMESTSLLIDLYHTTGIQLPLYNVWFLFTRANSLVIAIEQNVKFPSVRSEKIFTRWRSNAWFDGNVNMPLGQGILTGNHTYLGQTASWLAFSNRWVSIRGRAEGYAYAFVNGKRVSNIQQAFLAPGDVIWWVWDGSIKEVSEIKLSDIKSFISEMDTSSKYMYFRAGLGETIDYRDDADFFVLKYLQSARYEGVYYHRNQDDAIRNVTHRDYSLKSAYVDGYITGTVGWSYADDIRIQCFVRHSGWHRELVDEHHRIKDLYRLPEDVRRGAMIGDATQWGETEAAEVWAANALENSYYPKVMDVVWGHLTNEMVVEAYGYNAVSKLIGNLPFKVNAGQRWVDILYSQYCASTVFEYDENGVMLGWYPHRQHYQYAMRDPLTRYVEPIAGTGGLGLNTAYDTHKNLVKFELDPIRDYRFYKATVNDGIHQGDWADITGDDRFYTITNGVVTWTLDSVDGYNTAIRNDLDFLCYDLELNTTDDVAVFSITTTEVVKGLAGVESVMVIPPGEIELFLNGHGLTPGIDYYMKWPEFGIVNKTHLNTNGEQTITIRGRGFCKPDLTLDQPMDSGFISHGQLSRNARFNLRDDKVTRITVDGKLYLMDELAFSEDGTILDEEIKNGIPYCITHPIIPGLDLIEEDIYAYRAKAMIVDKEVEDYLSEYIPEVPNTDPNPIPEEYPVISLFCMRIIQDMRRGVLDMTPFEGRYTDQDLKRTLDNYAWLLDYDPVVNQYDTRNSVAHPHQFWGRIDLPFHQYQLLDRAINLYLVGGINLSRYARII